MRDHLNQRNKKYVEGFLFCYCKLLHLNAFIFNDPEVDREYCKQVFFFFCIYIIRSQRTDFSSCRPFQILLYISLIVSDRFHNTGVLTRIQGVWCLWIRKVTLKVNT
jgi:hypothetical protein